MSGITLRKKNAEATTSEAPTEALPVFSPRSVALPHVNLLPPEIVVRRTVRRAQMGLGGAALVAVAVVGVLAVLASGAVADAQEDLDVATAEQALVQRETTEYASVTQVYNAVDHGETMLEQAMGTEVQWSRYLNDLSLSIPQNVWLTSMDATQTDAAAAAPVDGTAVLTDPGRGTLTFAGMALEHDDVAVWLEALAEQEGYANPYFSSSAEELIGTKPVVAFSSTATLTDAAFSGRYVRDAEGS